MFICKPRPAATLGVQTWPRKRPGTTHTLWMRYELAGVGRILPTPPPLAFPVPRYRSSDHPNTPPPYRTSSMRIYLRESAADSPPFPLTSCLVSDGWTTPHLVSMIWKDMLVNDEHLTKVCDDWMPHIYWSGRKPVLRTGVGMSLFSPLSTGYDYESTPSIWPLFVFGQEHLGPTIGY